MHLHLFIAPMKPDGDKQEKEIIKVRIIMGLSFFPSKLNFSLIPLLSKVFFKIDIVLNKCFYTKC